MLASAKAEQERRRRLRTEPLLRFEDDPIGFVEYHLLGTLWSKQRAICESVRDHRQTAVPSCHDVGKSVTAALLACWWIACHPPSEAFVVTLAPTGHQVKAILWREMNRIHKQGRLPGRMLTTEWKLDDGELVAFGRSPADNDPTAAQGLHAKYVLVILDEACGIAKPLWDAVSSLTANEFSRTLAIGNPDEPSSEFEQVCKPGSGWNVIEISAFDSPNFTDEPVPAWLRPLLITPTWVEERKHKWGETSPVYRSKVLGRFPEQASDGLLPIGAVKAAVIRELQPGEDNVLGVDVARFGEDHSVIFHRRGPVARRIVKTAKRDLMHLTGEVMRALRETGARKVMIDDTGMGGGVTDRLTELKNGGDTSPEGIAAKALLSRVEIVPVNVGEAPTISLDPDDPKFQSTERFLNLRAQLNWAMRERFMDGDIDIEDLDDLQAQAVDIKYKLTSRGQLQIEAKADMKKRGRASPDDWDALVLCYAQVSTDLSIWEKLGRAA